jgi:hypothetical protein
MQWQMKEPVDAGLCFDYLKKDQLRHSGIIELDFPLI